MPSIIADYAIVQGVDEAAFSSALDADVVLAQSGDVEGWERLDWVVDAKVEAECVEAARRAKAIVDNSDNDELVFDAYGVDWIKEGASPTNPCSSPISSAALR